MHWHYKLNELIKCLHPSNQSRDVQVEYRSACVEVMRFLSGSSIQMTINRLRLGEIWKECRYISAVKGGTGTDLEGDTHDEDQKEICPGTQRQSWQPVYSLGLQTSRPFPRMFLLCFTTMVPAHQCAYSNVLPTSEAVLRPISTLFMDPMETWDVS